LGIGLGIETKRPRTKNSAAPIPIATIVLIDILLNDVPAITNSILPKHIGDKHFAVYFIVGSPRQKASPPIRKYHNSNVVTSFPSKRNGILGNRQIYCMGIT